MKLKLSPASRTLSECDRFDPNNTEFTISLLDCRFLLGDRDLFARLHDKTIPKLVARESKSLLQGLAEVTQERHGKFGYTVFHLEPNLKEAPGGFAIAMSRSWLALVSAMKSWRLAGRQFFARAGAEATRVRRWNFLWPLVAFCTSATAVMTTPELGGTGRSGGAKIGAPESSNSGQETGCGFISAMPAPCKNGHATDGRDSGSRVLRCAGNFSAGDRGPSTS